MQRGKQTEEFWRDEFAIWEEDETALQEYFLQRGEPMTREEVARQLMDAQLGGSTGPSPSRNGGYSPAESYEVGDRVAFSSRDGEVGEIVNVRDGQNDRYGPFQVISVRFGQGETRDYAASLAGMQAPQIENGVPQMEPAELYERYGSYVHQAMDESLAPGDTFVQAGGRWLPRVMLVDVHEGHRNIAEAMIDITGEAMSTADLLTEVSIPEEASDALKRFSLEYALALDERFVNVGTAETPLWHLRRLVPQEQS